MVISCETSRRCSEFTVFSSNAGSVVGLARAMPMHEPPRKWMRLTDSMVSGCTWSMSPRITHSKPSSMPMTSTPSSTERMVAAPMTLLMPGAGPPPTRIANFFRSLIASAPSLDACPPHPPVRPLFASHVRAVK